MTKSKNSDKTILVSIIMLTYNQQNTITEAIRSVVKQKGNFRLQLIIANDCSTDKTTQICQSWQEKYPHIITLLNREQNLGLQKNLLDAWSHSKGKYIAICEGDDHWCSSKKIARQLKYMETHPECSITFHPVINYYADRHEFSISNGLKTPKNSSIYDLAKKNYITNVSVMYRALKRSDLPNWIEQTKLTDYSIHMVHAAKGMIHYLPWPMAVYRQYSKGIWSGNRLQSLELAAEVRKLLIEHFKEDSKLVTIIHKALKDIQNAYIAAQQEPKNNNQSNKNLKKRITILIRRIISRIIPVPRIP